MQTLAGVFGLLGLAAAVAGLVLHFYVVMYGYKYAHPKDHKNPDWMVVLLRLYKRQIIAFFVLYAVAATALTLATHLGKHSS
jgi:membrane-bound ClpP family serine protease